MGTVQVSEAESGAAIATGLDLGQGGQHRLYLLLDGHLILLQF
jgi:hypothetical protein